MVLLMSVNPGFPGQKFIDETYKKISLVRELIDKSGNNIRLEVDGGVNLDNIIRVARAGADTFVAGSAIFNSDNYQDTINSMRDLLSQVD
jgi:ribulose-phosphate 3-epimerase